MASQHSLPGLGGVKGAPPELGIHNQAHFPSSPAFSCPSSYMQGLLSPCCRPILLICNPTTCLNHPLFPKWMMPLPSESPQHSTGISCGRPSPYSFKSHLCPCLRPLLRTGPLTDSWLNLPQDLDDGWMISVKQVLKAASLSPSKESMVRVLFVSLGFHPGSLPNLVQS